MYGTGLETYLTYLAACALVLVVPGPTVLLVVAYGLSEGRRAALAVVCGVTAGDAIALALSLGGLGALLATSAAAFSLLKWLGAAYLIYLGLKMWRAQPNVPTNETVEADGRTCKAPWQMAAHACLVTALNPKPIAFFIAFLPQFVDPSKPLLPQCMLLGGTFLTLGTMNAAGYALLASKARSMVRKPGVLRWANRAGGGALIGAGLATATLQRK